MPTPTTPELLEQLHQTTAAYTIRRLGAAGQVHRDGTALQWMLPAVPVGIFNTAFGLDPGDEGQLERVLGRFTGAGLPPRLEVLPHQLTPVFARRLAAHGLVACDTRVLMYAEADEICTSDTVPGVELEPVDTSNLARFVRVDQDAGGNPEEGPAERFAGWLEQPGLSLWLATIEGQTRAWASCTWSTLPPETSATSPRPPPCPTSSDGAYSGP